MDDGKKWRVLVLLTLNLAVGLVAADSESMRIKCHINGNMGRSFVPIQGIRPSFATCTPHRWGWIHLLSRPCLFHNPDQFLEERDSSPFCCPLSLSQPGPVFVTPI